MYEEPVQVFSTVEGKMEYSPQQSNRSFITGWTMTNQQTNHPTINNVKHCCGKASHFYFNPPQTPTTAPDLKQKEALPIPEWFFGKIGNRPH